MRIKKPLGYYDYTVILTYAGMLCAFQAILMAINARYWDSLIFLMISGLCDMFDGTVASTKPRNMSERRFGIQIDSLCDLLSFGVAPAIFVYMISGKNPYAGFLSSLFALAALIRLAYFNVGEEQRQTETNEKRTVFYGMPVTTIAVIMPLVYIVQKETGNKSSMPYIVALLICGVCFLMPVEVKKPGHLGRIILILFGIVEAAGVFFLGWDLV